MNPGTINNPIQMNPTPTQVAEPPKKCKHMPIIIILAILTVAGIGFGGFELWQNMQKDNDIKNLQADKAKLGEQKAEKEDNNTAPEGSLITINKRLYSVNSDLNQQRYYLLLDDATYDANQDFLTKKTYILDMDMTNGNEIVKEVDLASVFKPIVDEYINSYNGDKSGTCTVEYFSAVKDSVPPTINYNEEVAFKGYYRCTNGNTEKSLGSKDYAYNIKTNTIREL